MAGVAHRPQFLTVSLSLTNSLPLGSFPTIRFPAGLFTVLLVLNRVQFKRETKNEGESKYYDMVMAVCLATWYALQTDPHMSEYQHEGFNKQNDYNPLTGGL